MSNPGAASTSTSTYVGGGAPAHIGNATTDLVGFYGTAGVAQQTKATAVATTASSSTTNAYGYTTAAQADAIVTAVNAIIVQLTALGMTT
jgi:UDP-N-acetyl-D-mannosaminuronic acid transferase (WecB/TagA/CpsF family)